MNPAWREFQIHGQFLRAEALRVGLINETYVATYDQGGAPVRYIHQKLNGNVFKKPAAVMQNIECVTAHIRRKLEARGMDQVTRRVLTVIPTRTGAAFCEDDDGHFWRTFIFIEGAQTHADIQTPAQAFYVGQAYGEFQSLLRDLPGRLAETIPHFHDTPKRFAALLAAVKKDCCGRAAGAGPEIEFALQRRAMTGVIVDAMAKGEIPERITHNDTKFNNVMLDAATGRALCVVDLDTVMPGCALYDFGDMVRSATNTAAEDERNLTRVTMDMARFKQLAKGYLSQTKSFLTRREKELLAFSGKLISFELGLRFLTDHLNGDTYFHASRPGQNLDRCRVQFALVESIEAQEEKMCAVVEKLTA